MKYNNKTLGVEREIYATIEKMGLPVDFKLELKPFSKRYLGRYNPNNSKVIAYYQDENGELLDIDYLMENIIHECIHHYQWKHEVGFTRLKGVMHNNKFKIMEEKYLKKYKRLRKRGDINVAYIKENMDEVNELLN